MAAQREKIFAALYARLAAISYFKYSSRILESWDDTPPAAQPAFFLVKGPEEAGVKVQGAPSAWRLLASLVLYVQNDQTTHEDPSAAPSTALNDAITYVEEALQFVAGEAPSLYASFPPRPPGNFGTTLGGLCYSCQIVGTVQVFDGVIAGTAVAILPIEILTTA